MKSSEGVHYLALDHVRALAAFLVFAWHFLHGEHGFPVPFLGAPSFFPLALFDEGHVGVSLFMVLSGYLFAKLLGGRTVLWKWFWWNRVLRLLPLLVLVFVAIAMQEVMRGGRWQDYLLSLGKGFVLPTWPGGGWSVAVELHFYLLLPLLLYAARESRGRAIVLAIVCVLALRVGLWWYRGEVHSAAYWTLIGRFDQFALGVLAFFWRAHIQGHRLVCVAVFALFLWFYSWFDASGGFHGMPSYPSSSWVWIVLPTIEGLGFAALVGGYDAWYSGLKLKGRASDLQPSLGLRIAEFFSLAIGKVGEWSYSMYLLHFFVVFWMAKWVDATVMRLDGFLVTLGWALVCFIALLPFCWLSYVCIERPALRFRRRYLT